jgi:hypothetical protein
MITLEGIIFIGIVNGLLTSCCLVYFTPLRRIFCIVPILPYHIRNENQILDIENGYEEDTIQIIPTEFVNINTNINNQPNFRSEYNIPVAKEIIVDNMKKINKLV